MRNLRSMLPVVLLGAAVLVGACGSEPATPSGDDTLNADPDKDPCLLGTWRVDEGDLADQMAALMQMPGVTTHVEGTITVVIGEQIVTTYDDYALTLTVPLGSVTSEMTMSTSGTATNAEWTAKDGTLTVSPAEGDLDFDTKVVTGGVTVPGTIPIPNPGQDTTTQFTYTCSGDTATIAGPVPAPTRTLTRL